MIEGGKTPLLTAAELQEIGFTMVVYPLSGLFSAAKAIGETYRALHDTKTTASRRDAMVDFHEFEAIVDASGWRDTETRHSVR